MSRLIAEGKRVPVFTLRDASSNADVRLEAFLRKRRVVLLFLSGREEGDCCRAWLKTARAAAAQIAERDLTVLVMASEPESVAEAQKLPEPFVVLRDPRGQVAAAYGGSPSFYLVGKDGTIKRSSHTCVPLPDLFGLIDAMPMRRQEVREKAGRH
jgi:peroxiredoxin